MASDRHGLYLWPMNPFPSSRMRFTAGLALALVATGCEPGARSSDAAARGDRAPAQSESAYAPMQMDLAGTPAAISLLGEPLHPMVLDPATEAALHARIDSAEAAYEADPDDPDALIWLGRRLGYAGHYREAIDVYAEGIRRHPDDARLYRHRGHRYITLRELDAAIDDLELAARMISGTADVVEPDGMPNDAGVPRSTLQTNIWYHLGLARYLQHDFEGAVHAFGRGYELSPNDDMRVAMADWLWLSLKRLGRDDEAVELLGGVSPEMEILENEAYHRRLLVYKGELDPDSLVAGGLSQADPLTVATHGYGLGAWWLIRGDRPRAVDAFRQVLETGYWPAFGYIAAEAELAALGETAPLGPAPSSRALKTPDPSPVDSM
ncbi:MAG: tetratricopeptide repeat protein [Candidatus Longimicrobiales bacterium M2_2A_002]